MYVCMNMAWRQHQRVCMYVCLHRECGQLKCRVRVCEVL